MPTRRVIVSASRPELRRAMAKAILILTGKVADSTGLLREAQRSIGLVALSLIREAFVTKSRGGTDDCGEKWAPLARSTIARRRLGKGDRKLLTLKARLAQLSPEEQKRVKRDIRDRRALLVARGMDPAEAGRVAQVQAMNAGRRRGGTIPTRQDILGARQVEILRDYGPLLASLSPGDVKNILEVLPGRVIVGTNDPKAPHHQKGGPHLPQRRVIPPPELWPAEWWRQLSEAAQAGLLRIAEALLRAEGRVLAGAGAVKRG